MLKEKVFQGFERAWRISSELNY